jgi:arylsulfatase A-like enzyme
VRKLFSLAAIFFSLTLSTFAAGLARHVVVVVWDGMRPDFISEEHTPALKQLVRDGVMFENNRAAYCSATEVNGTTLATGVYPENSGIIANRDYFPRIEPLRSVATESHEVIRKGDSLTGGKYLLRPTLAEILRAAGKTTAIAGTKPVALMHDRHECEGCGSAVVFEGKTSPGSLLASIRTKLGGFPFPVRASSSAPNEPRDEWTTRVLLESLWSNTVPAFSLLWLSEPDVSQHAAELGSPKAIAAIESSDRKLAAVLAELGKRGLRESTDIFVVSDHGFSTAERSLDICEAVRSGGFSAFREFRSPPKKGDILVVGQGGSILFFVIGHDAETTRKLVDFLQRQDFAGVMFTRKKLPGTFTLAQAKINSRSEPDVVLSLRWTAEKSAMGIPGMLISDGNRRTGTGLHASLSRFDMRNTLVGAGPDLKKGFSNTLPTGNIDLAPTILWLLGVKPAVPMDGRVLSEALTVPAPKVGKPRTTRLQTERRVGGGIWSQYLQISRVNGTIYLDEGNGGIKAK